MAPEKPVIRRILNKLGPELFEKLMIVQEADTMAKKPVPAGENPGTDRER